MKKFISEFIGTMVLVIFGCGSAITNGFGMGYLGIAFAFGLVIVAMAYSIGNISGCHINPAVSLSMLVLKKISLKDFWVYISAQFLGSTLGAMILVVLLGTSKGLGTNGFAEASNAGLGMGQAFLAEVILTFVFIIAIIGVTSVEKYSSIAGLVIALTLVLVHIMGVPLTGTSVNPARSFGPALIMGGKAFSQLWVFIVAPMIGSLLAAVTYKYLDAKK